MRLLKLCVSIYLIFISANYNNKEFQNERSIKRYFSDSKYNYNNDYIAVLSIPKINFERGLYPKESSLNNIAYNIAFLKESEYPSLNSNTIIIGHSGNSNISYFEDLKKLVVGDEIFLFYENFKYHFIINDIYTVKKNRNVKVRRDKNRKTITLITCYERDKQLVIIGYEKNRN